MISPAELQAFIDATYARAGVAPNVDKVILPKWFGITFAAIAVGATSTLQIPISANGDFFVTTIRFRPSLAAAAQTTSTVPVPNLRCLITDTGSDEQWSNQAIDINQMGQLGSGPSVDMDLAFPRVIAGRSSVTVQLTSFEAAATPLIDFSLVGVLVKLFATNQLYNTK